MTGERMANSHINLKLGLLFLVISIQTSQSNGADYVLTKEDNDFLDDLQQRSFQFFWEHSNEKNGLTLDRAFTDGRPPGTGDRHIKIG